MPRLAGRVVPVRRPGGPTMQLVRRVSLGLIGVLLALLLAEVALRVARPIPSDELLPLPFHERRLRRLVNGQAYLTYDQMLGWVTTPKVSQQIDGDTYRHNNAGLRADREYAPDPPPGVHRIGAFGDSFTYCHEVDLRDCWTARLERAWPGTEVLNFGVPGYGPDQAWLRYRRDGPALRPCAVLVGFMVENLNRVVNRYRPSLVPTTDLLATKPRFLLDGDGLALLPNPAVTPDLLADQRWVEQAAGPNDRWHFPGLFADSPLDMLEIARVARTAAFRYQHGDPDGEGMLRAYRQPGEAFEVARRVLIQFAREASQDGAAPVVVVFPETSQIKAVLGGQPPIQSALVESLVRESIAVVDLTDDVVAEARRSGVGEVIGYHYTPLGNRVVAEALAARLPPLLPDCHGA